MRPNRAGAPEFWRSWAAQLSIFPRSEQMLRSGRETKKKSVDQNSGECRHVNPPLSRSSSVGRYSTMKLGTTSSRIREEVHTDGP
jgi:hypothetical protein